MFIPFLIFNVSVFNELNGSLFKAKEGFALQHKILSSSTFLKLSHDCTHDVMLSSDLKQLVVFSSTPGGCFVMRMPRSSLDASASPLRYSILLLVYVCFSLPFLGQTMSRVTISVKSPYLWETHRLHGSEPLNRVVRVSEVQPAALKAKTTTHSIQRSDIKDGITDVATH